MGRWRAALWPVQRPSTAGRDPLLSTAAAACVVTVVGYGLDLGGRVTQVVACWLALAAFHTALVVVAYRVTARMSRRPVRRFWRALTFAGLAYTVGDVIQFGVIARAPTSIAGAIGGVPQSLCVLAGTLPLVGVVLTFPLDMAGGPRRWRFWLDAATVMVATGTFGAYSTDLVVTGTGWTSRLFSVVLQVLLGPGVFLVAVFAVVKLLLGGQAPFTRPAGMLCCAAATIEGVAQAVSGPLISGGRLAWVLGLNLIASIVLTGSARLQYLQVRADPDRLLRRRPRPYSLLPYVAIGATYLLLVVVLARAGLDGRSWMVVVGAITSTGLVVARQILALADNGRLVADLTSSLRERDQLAGQLRHLAYHDSLTGLANRALFQQELDNAIANQEAPVPQLVVMLIDLDDFKPVNDTFGHAAGDGLLVEVGARLRRCVRDSDLVARLGGDEFAVLLRRPAGHDITDVAERIIAAVEVPVSLTGTTVTVRASVGVAVCASGERDGNELLQYADRAMYAAKGSGKGHYEILRPSHPGRPRGLPVAGPR
jgi:diguanylate cyclase (GGDEF)-like protein